MSSIALFVEPHAAQKIAWRAGDQEVVDERMLLGIHSDEGQLYGICVNEEGYLSELPLEQLRTKHRWDPDLQDWVDEDELGEPSVIDDGEPEVTQAT